MFQSTCYHQPIPTTWDTSSVTIMNNMFQSNGNGNECIEQPHGYGIPQLPATFDTSSVTDMKEMFKESKYTGHLDMFDTSLVTDMRNMFRSSALTAVVNFDISQVAQGNFQGMFDSTNIPDCTMKVTYANLRVTDTNNYFQDAYGQYLARLCQPSPPPSPPLAPPPPYGTVPHTIHFFLNVTGTSVENNADLAPRLSGGSFERNGPLMALEDGLWHRQLTFTNPPGTAIDYKFAWGENPTDYSRSESQSALAPCGIGSYNDRHTQVPEGHHIISQTWEVCSEDAPLVWSSPPPASPPRVMAANTFEYEYTCGQNNCYEVEQSWTLTCGGVTVVTVAQNVKNQGFISVTVPGPGPCKLRLDDSYGDGWNKGALTIYGVGSIDSVVSTDSSFIYDGSGVFTTDFTNSDNGGDWKEYDFNVL